MPGAAALSNTWTCSDLPFYCLLALLRSSSCRRGSSSSLLLARPQAPWFSPSQLPRRRLVVVSLPLLLLLSTRSEFLPSVGTRRYLTAVAFHARRDFAVRRRARFRRNRVVSRHVSPRTFLAILAHDGGTAATAAARDSGGRRRCLVALAASSL